MAAFEAAIQLGYTYLETDVRVTADGVAVAFHDATLDRVTDARGRINMLTYQQLRSAHIAGKEPIPQLVDVLAAWPDARINIDVKADSGVAATAEAIRRTNAIDRVCVGAFSTARVLAVRRALGPELCTSLGPRSALRLRFRPTRVRALEGRCAQVPARIGRRPFVDARYLAAARRQGLQVHAWTVNDRDEMIRLLDLGVDGIMTDRADVLRELLIGRGQWHERGEMT